MYERLPFQIESKFKVVKPFTMNGIPYWYDEPVDITGIEPRRVRQMWDARMIEVMPAADKPVQATEKPAKATKTEAAPTPASAEKPVVEASQEPRLEHRGFGKYEIVDAAGNVLAGPLPKEQAERELLKHR
jgi:hypothetical protein